MKRVWIVALGASTLGAFLALGACDNSAAPAATSAPVAGEATPVAAEVPAPPPPENQLGGIQRWSITNNGSANGNGNGTAGKASLAAGSILSIVAEKAPVAVGDVITVKANVTVPANRPFRVFAMRHCDNANGDDLTSVDFMGTGSSMPVEVTHTFKAGYGCMRMSLTAADKKPMDVELRDVYFIKAPKS